MEISNLPYEQELEVCDLVINTYTKRKEERIAQRMQEIRSPEAREAYELTEDPMFAQYLGTLGHDVGDRGAVMHALMLECSTREVTAFGYLCLASGVCQQRFHDLQENYYRWRDGHLDGGAA